MYLAEAKALALCMFHDTCLSAAAPQVCQRVRKAERGCADDVWGDSTSVRAKAHLLSRCQIGHIQRPLAAPAAPRACHSVLSAGAYKKTCMLLLAGPAAASKCTHVMAPWMHHQEARMINELCT